MTELTELTDPDLVKYTIKARRMVGRWAGIRGPGRKNNNPTEAVYTREGEEEEVEVLEDVVEEPSKTIPVHDRCEVLVVGGGPSGLSAALAARRAGADVILMERFGCFGGVITTVGMETLAWYRYEGTVDTEGIGIEMERLAASMGGSIKWPYNDSECLDADFFKVVADHLVRTSGVRPLLHSYAVDVIKEGDTLKGIIMESKSGRRAILAERIIDCTGDADVAHLAGAQYRMTDKKERMGVTSVFNCSGVEKEKFLEYTEKNPATYKVESDRARVGVKLVVPGLVQDLGPGDLGQGGFSAQSLPRPGVREGERERGHPSGGHSAHWRLLVCPHQRRGGHQPQPRPRGGSGLHGRQRPDQGRDGGKTTGDIRSPGSQGRRARLPGRQTEELRDDDRDERQQEDHREIQSDQRGCAEPG